MNFLPIYRTQTGIEICSDKFRSAVVYKKAQSCWVKEIAEIGIPAGIVKPSFKKKNIENESEFSNALKKISKHARSGRVNVAIPDSSSKVLIKQFNELPSDPDEINEMVLWSISDSLGLSMDEIRVSCSLMGQNMDGKYVFLIALSMDEVISQYEEVFKKTGISPKSISPAGINQFNYYSGHIPDNQAVVYLALFDDFINIFVFSNGIPVLYKMVKRDLFRTKSDSAINDIDLLIQYFESENPNFEIDHFFIASHIKSNALMEQILQNFLFAGVSSQPDTLVAHGPQDKERSGYTVFKEEAFMGFDKNMDIQQLPFFTTVLGTAKGLLA